MKSKSLAINSLYNILYRCLNVFFPLATSMYVSRVLLSDGIGEVASARNLVTYFTLLAAAGLPTYGTKIIAELRNDDEKKSKVFSELFIINFISTIIYTTIYLLIVFNVKQYSSELSLYLIVGLQIVLNIFNIDWFYQGIEEYKYIMLRSLIVKVLCFALIIFFVHTPDDYIVYAFATVLGVALNYVWNVINLQGKIKFVISGLNLKRHLRFILVLFASVIAIEIYSLADITMLTYMATKSNVGYYSNAMNSVKTVKELIVAICAVFLPRLSYYYHEKQYDQFNQLAIRGIKILTFFSIPATAGCFILADKLVLLLFGSAFLPSALTVRILCISIITVGLSNFIGYQVLVITGHEKKMFWISLFGAVFNIILNSIFIPKYLHNGAAFASAITEVIVCLLYMYFYYNIVGDNGFKKHLSVTVLSTIGMLISVYIVNSFAMPVILSCVIAIFIGILVYSVLTIALKNEIAILVSQNIKRKFYHNE